MNVKCICANACTQLKITMYKLKNRRMNRNRTDKFAKKQFENNIEQERTKQKHKQIAKTNTIHKQMIEFFWIKKYLTEKNDIDVKECIK